MILMLSLLLLAAPQVQPEASSAADAAFAVFQKNCVGCHGDTGFAKSYMLLDRAAMVKTGKIAPGHAEESILYKRITGAIEPTMPQDGPKLPDRDIAIIRRWIDDGAPDWKFSPAEPRRFLSNEDVVAAIEKDLTSAGTDTSRQFFRYFTLTNLYNTGDAKLPTYRSALFKLINSLSWDKDITLPVIIDREQTILRIDIREYDWTDPARTWETILEGYPYGVESSGSAYARIQAITSSRIPFIRADWFLAAASMPPLYHDILELPSNEADLETCGGNSRRCVHIDAQRNLQDSPGLRVVRAGFTESGVSNSNRVVERHRSPYGAYWKSHDFPDNVGDHNIFQHPLDFQRAGGEIIFSLPNGLQGYMLVDARGARLDQAPTNIVFNKGGSRAEIRNGLSCMSCHANGMRSLTDDVRATLSARADYDRVYAAALYPENSVLKKLIAEDQTRFETALRKTGVQPGVEPIGELSERYATSVDARAAASELGFTKDEFLRRLAQSETLRQLGLATLLSGGTVKRDAWEDAFGDVVQEFQAGVWIPPTRAYGERFFNGSSVPPRRPSPPIFRNLSGQLPSIFSAVVGRPVSNIQDGRERTYSLRDVRSSAPCSIEILDVTRLNEPGIPSQWWSEEDTQSFSLARARVSLAPEGPVSRLTVRTDTPTIRLERTFLSSNQWRGDASLPRAGSRIESVDTVIFDLPPGPEAARVFESLRDAIAECRL
jgi:Cytochrome C oxidase, cbb3-type, subunit III